MRDLIASLAIVLLLIGGWLIFDSYSSANIDKMTDMIYKDIIPLVESENWEESKEKMKALDASWDKYKNKALFFLNNEEISEIDYAIAKSYKYVKAEDVSNSSGELSSVAEQMFFLYQREKIAPENIF
ncbi:MAG: DUF4363 family protein [Anaerovoracaceae bacterium]|nr:DUF4363 family protein [Bacillota bacterium]MEE0517909.1 DUF4363 family protein [Anaerovoracaceae bacterium]